MDIYARELEVVMGDGRGKMIQDIAPTETVLGRGGAAHTVLACSTHQGAVYPVSVGDVKFYVPGTQALPFVCVKDNIFAKQGALVHLQMNVVATQPAAVVHTLRFVVPGVRTYPTVSTMPRNAAFAGRWANWDPRTLKQHMHSLSRKKKAAMVALFDVHRIDPVAQTVPAQIFTASVESRLSFVRGFIDAAGHRIVKPRQKGLFAELFTEMRNISMYHPIARVVNSLGYQTCRRGNLLAIQAPSHKCLKRLLRKGATRLCDHVHSVPFEVGNTRQDIFYSLHIDVDPDLGASLTGGGGILLS